MNINSALVNRSKLYYDNSNYEKSLEDLNKCIELIDKESPEINYGKPIDKDVEKWKLVIYVRRGTILTKIGNLKNALEDYEKAVLIDPSNTSLKNDLLQIKARLIPIKQN